MSSERVGRYHRLGARHLLAEHLQAASLICGLVVLALHEGCHHYALIDAELLGCPQGAPGSSHALHTTILHSGGVGVSEHIHDVVVLVLCALRQLLAHALYLRDDGLRFALNGEEPGVIFYLRVEVVAIWQRYAGQRLTLRFPL